MEVLHCCLFLRKPQKFFSNCFDKRGWRVTWLEVLSGTGGVAKALALKAVVWKLSRRCWGLPGWSPLHLEYWWGGIFLVSMHMRLEKGRNHYCIFWINVIIPEKTRKQKGKEQRAKQHGDADICCNGFSVIWMSDVSYGAQNNKFTQNCWTASSSDPPFQSTVCLETEMEGDGEKPHRTGNQQNWILLPSTSINFLKDSRRITFFPGCHFSILFISRDTTISNFPFPACFACSECTRLRTLWLTSAQENTVNRRSSRRKLLWFERLDFSIFNIWEMLSQLRDNHCFRAGRD